jgi:kynurenine 3-monooxygenase
LKPDPQRTVNIVGAGLAGALLAVLLARRGVRVALYDRRPDPRQSDAESGRSINLALAARGIRALERAGVMDRIRPLLIPMRGRMVHGLSGSSSTLQPYGQREHEVIYSVGRSALNRVLIEEAARYDTVTTRFDQACLGAVPERNVLRFRNRVEGVEYEVALGTTIATDGAGSAVRTSLAADGHVSVREDWLDHDYKELTIPAAARTRTAAPHTAAPLPAMQSQPATTSPPAQAAEAGKHVLEPHALHVWPRGGFMLIALPNTDGSFTATLFLARTGHNGFSSLAASQAVNDFFRREFADAVPLMPDLLEEFAAHPQGQLGTVHLTPWHVGGRILLLGDAAHAIVPFHGQGMNAAFEDCLVLDALLDRHDEWHPLFAEFEQSRRPNAAAIAQMALENYLEMRDAVLDAGFVRRKAIAMELERRFPNRFIPRYSMVMFHPEIPYAEAQRRGTVQAQLLEELDSTPDASGATDFVLAEKLVKERLEPID